MSRNRNQLCSERILVAVLRLLFRLLMVGNANHRRRDFALGIRNPLFLGCPVEQCRVNVAELLHFLERHAVLHELLLRLHDFGRLDRVELFPEILPHRVERLTLTETREIALQCLRSLRLCIRKIVLRSRRHRRLDRGSRRRGRRRLGRRHRRAVCSAHLKALRLKGLHNLLHRDALHAGALRHRHHLTRRSQNLRLRDLLEADTRHNLLEFRVLRCELVHCFSEIYDFIHGYASKVVCSSLPFHYSISPAKNRDYGNKS